MSEQGEVFLFGMAIGIALLAIVLGLTGTYSAYEDGYCAAQGAAYKSGNCLFPDGTYKEVVRD